MTDEDKEFERRLAALEEKLGRIEKSVDDAWASVFKANTLSRLESAAKALEDNEFTPRLLPFVVEWRVADGFGGVIEGRSESALWLARDMIRICRDGKANAPTGEDPAVLVECLSYDGKPTAPPQTA